MATVARSADPKSVSGLRDRLRIYLAASWRILLKEIMAFGVVGFVAFAVDLGIFNALLGYGTLKAKCASTVVSTTVAYFGNKHLSFSHRAQTGLRRETTWFFAINIFWLGVSEATLAVFDYPLGYRDDAFVLNIVNLVTIVFGTVFRFWAYKRFVFPHPDRVAADTRLDYQLAE